MASLWNNSTSMSDDDDITVPHDSVVSDFALEHGILKWTSTSRIMGKERAYARRALDNPNATIVVIQSMCLAIVFTDHELHKMQYFRDLVQGNLRGIDGYRGKYYIISTEWDTALWSLYKLTIIHAWIRDIEQMPMDEIRGERFMMMCTIPDIAFLEAMSWNPLRPEPIADDSRLE
jgi:hypothetical protein